ncbi:DUF2272 domain-containing protein [Thiorhodococcus fuscus]|uniref:DUF2272 domain-containing protein n=1 Tax=Thiorhodococcus fuscus TaxID=527200 RepID=A0ABW4YD75_9GAMM
MPTLNSSRIRVTAATTSLLCLLVLGCAAPPPGETGGGGSGSTWAGRPIGAPPSPNPRLRQRIIDRALGEWNYFGRQTIVFQGDDESMPHVGYWEDDDGSHSRRVNSYWRAAGEPGLDGMDCQKPWSAAFMSWVMQSAGVPESQFSRSIAHWVYLARMVDAAAIPGRYFVPRRLKDYSPKPGDLVCASRNPARVFSSDVYVTSRMLYSLSAHCDLVVSKQGRTLETVGGNVRNSVSKSRWELDPRGLVKPNKRRPWFLIMENRL